MRCPMKASWRRADGSRVASPDRAHLPSIEFLQSRRAAAREELDADAVSSRGIDTARQARAGIRIDRDHRMVHEDPEGQVLAIRQLDARPVRLPVRSRVQTGVLAVD